MGEPTDDRGRDEGQGPSVVARLGAGDGEVLVVSLLAPGCATFASGPTEAVLCDVMAGGRLSAGDRFVAAAEGADLVAVARASARVGLRATLVTSERSGAARVAAARALGADVRVDPAAEGPDALRTVATRVASERTTLPVVVPRDESAWTKACAEVAAELDTLLPAGAPVCLTGAERALARALSESGGRAVRQVVGRRTLQPGAADSERSIFLGCQAGPPAGGTVLQSVPDADVAAAAARLARECGVLTSAAGALAVAAALHTPERGPRVALLVEDGRHELDTLHAPHWLRHHGLLRVAGRLTAAELFEQRHGDLPSLVSLGPDSPLGDAISIMQQLEVSQIPIMDGDRVVGTLRDDQIIDLLLHAPEQRHEPVRQVMDDPLPELPGEASLDDVQAAILGGAPAVLIQLPDARLGILTKYDLIHGLSLS